MTVEEFAEWLNTFPDQKAEVNVIEHHDCRSMSYYQQGGYVQEEPFDPNKHTEYTDFRNNEFVKPNAAHFGKSYLLIGARGL